MNRGSALKWADLIDDMAIPMNTNGGCLRDYEGFDFLGILQDFVSGIWRDTGLGFFVTEDGCCGLLSPIVVKKCKIKSRLLPLIAITDGIGIDDTSETILDCRTIIKSAKTNNFLYYSKKGRNAVSNWIRNNYESL